MKVEGEEEQAYTMELVEKANKHATLSFTAWYEAACLIHKSAKESAR